MSDISKYVNFEIVENKSIGSFTVTATINAKMQTHIARDLLSHPKSDEVLNKAKYELVGQLSRLTRYKILTELSDIYVRMIDIMHAQAHYEDYELVKSLLTRISEMRDNINRGTI